MKILKTLLKGAVWLLLLGLLLAPLYGIYQISREELRQYEAPEAPVLAETAYGAVARSLRRDMQETVTLKGEFSSESYAEMVLDVRRPDLIHWAIEPGSEIEEGQVIGTLRGEEIVSTVTGIVTTINAYSAENAWLRVQEYTPLVFRCRLSEAEVRAVTGAQALSLADGSPVELRFLSHRRNADGTTTAEFSFESEDCRFGQILEALTLYTGWGYPQVLVLDERCLYQKTVGEEEPWFVRQVTEDGYFIAEREVTPGYTQDGLVAVSGIEEGMFFDTGYGAVAAGGTA